MKLKKPSLKAAIADELMTARIMSYKDLVALAKKYGAKTSTAERRLRGGEDWNLPVRKLNAKLKPLKIGQPIAFYKWIGKTIFIK